ncbi:RPA-interacting protein A [Megalopta genalis]|uniref:RPA-interacting protein A n=1 Tax=Megalopta genalis TaxID=115081 RepID=UPI003FD32703
MENVILSPTMLSKFKSLECARKMRSGSYRWQHALRERCQRRMREKRGQRFNGGRYGLIFSKSYDFPMDILEANELENDKIKKEELWILEEYEKLCQEELEALTSTDEVICPMCQKSNLAEVARQVTCTSCAFKLNNTNLQEVGYLISETVNSHSTTCTKVPGLMPLTENSIECLYLFCDECSTLMPILKIE